MRFVALDNSSQSSLSALYSHVFSCSEGKEQGDVLGKLSAQLAETIDAKHTLCFGAFKDEKLRAAIFFTRLSFGSAHNVFLLSPVAVDVSCQRQGVGQSLIRFGLEELRRRGIEVVVTYGDPAYYMKVGFEPLSESVIQAPHKLSMPFGWLGQSLTLNKIPILSEKPRCHPAFNDPTLW